MRMPQFKNNTESAEVDNTELDNTELDNADLGNTELDSAGSDISEMDHSELESEGIVGAENIEVDSAIFLSEESSEGFLPEIPESEMSLQDDDNTIVADVSGTELDEYEAVDIEDVEFVEEERLESIIESILFASDRPVSLASIKLVFKGTNIRTQHIKRALDQLAVEYAGGRRGITLEEAPGGFQLKTKIDNLEFLKRTLKARPFKLSGPALEVLAISAYKQPIVKSEIDEIRGVESGHLLRALMERGLVAFDGKSDLPGRPMQYCTTKRFLEIFGLRNLKELPTLSQIDELLPEGMDAEESQQKPTLSQISDSLAEQFTGAYSQGEEELEKIQNQLEEISTTTDFFEQEKLRQRQKRDEEKAQNLREALLLGEPVSNRDKNWLKKYDEALAAGLNASEAVAEITVHEQDAPPTANHQDMSRLEKAVNDFEQDTDQAIAIDENSSEDDFEESLFSSSEASEDDEDYIATEEEVEGV